MGQLSTFSTSDPVDLYLNAQLLERKKLSLAYLSSIDRYVAALEHEDPKCIIDSWRNLSLLEQEIEYFDRKHFMVVGTLAHMNCTLDLH